MSKQMFTTWGERLERAASGEEPLKESYVRQFARAVLFGSGGRPTSLSGEEKHSLERLFRSFPEGVAITMQQTVKGLNWWRNLLADKQRSEQLGVEERMRDVIADFAEFRFVGESYGVPIYLVKAQSGSWFSYSYQRTPGTGAAVLHLYAEGVSEDMLICDECGEATDEGVTETVTGSALCDSCVEEDTMYPSTLLRFGAWGGRDEVQFGDSVVVGGEMPSWADDLFAGGRFDGRHYTSTDGWRGYYDTSVKFDTERFIEVTDGWVTGDYEDVSWKADSHRFMERLEQERPPVVLYVLFEPTSNVFSTAASFWVAREDHAAFVEWAEAGVSIERLSRALG